MLVIVACEESQAVVKEFRKRGHTAFSCDIKPCSGGHPEWHIIDDAFNVLAPVNFIYPVATPVFSFKTQDGVYHSITGFIDILIAFPPCTYLTKAGANRYYKNNKFDIGRFNKGTAAAKFFNKFYTYPYARSIAIENPIPLKRFKLPRYSQIIQPYNFGENYKKTTCLWLKNLPFLMNTNLILQSDKKI